MKTLPLAATAAIAALLGLAVDTAAAKTCVTVPFGTELIDDGVFCASSHLAASGGNTYGPENLFYAQGRETAWCEAADGAGIGQWVSVATRPKLPVRSVLIHNGYQKTRKSFADNNRVRRLRIETENGTRLETTLTDRFGPQRIRLPDWEELGRIRITILDVYKGAKYDDTCLSVVWPDIEEIREKEWQEMNYGTPFKKRP